MSSVTRTLVSKPDGVNAEFYFTSYKNTVKDCLFFRVSFFFLLINNVLQPVKEKEIDSETSFVNMAFLIMSAVSSRRFPFCWPRLNLQGKIT